MKYDSKLGEKISEGSQALAKKMKGIKGRKCNSNKCMFNKPSRFDFNYNSKNFREYDESTYPKCPYRVDGRCTNEKETLRCMEEIRKRLDSNKSLRGCVKNPFDLEFYDSTIEAFDEQESKQIRKENESLARGMPGIYGEVTKMEEEEGFLIVTVLAKNKEHKLKTRLYATLSGPHFLVISDNGSRDILIKGLRYLFKITDKKSMNIVRVKEIKE